MLGQKKAMNYPQGLEYSSKSIRVFLLFLVKTCFYQETLKRKKAKLVKYTRDQAHDLIMLFMYEYIFKRITHFKMHKITVLLSLCLMFLSCGCKGNMFKSKSELSEQYAKRPTDENILFITKVN